MAWTPQGKSSPAGSLNEAKDSADHTSGYKTLSPRCVLIIGGIGSGKSTVGNTLLGKDAFQVGSNLLSSTRKPEMQESNDKRKWMNPLKVLYTPSLPHVVNQLEENVSDWKKMIGPFPDVILLIFKLERYPLDEYKAYEAMKEAWGQEDFCQRLVVVFTHCRNLTQSLADLWPSLHPKVQDILRDAEFRVVNFEEDQSPAQREAFLQSVMRHLWLIREAEGESEADESRKHREEILEVFGESNDDMGKDIREFLKEKNQTRQREASEVLERFSKVEGSHVDAFNWKRCVRAIFVGLTAGASFLALALCAKFCNK